MNHMTKSSLWFFICNNHCIVLQVFKINTFLCQTHQIVNSRKVILEIVEEVYVFEKGFGSFICCTGITSKDIL